MTETHRQYVKDNMLLFTTSRRYQPEEIRMIFEIYNAITGQKNKPTSCGRCVQTAKQTIVHYYENKRS